MAEKLNFTDARLLDFLKMQNERLKFYGSDFWEVSKFFSGILTVLLSIPFAFLLSQHRPHWWIFAAVWAPLLATIVAVAAFFMLQRLAMGYYAAAASVLTLERLLGLHEIPKVEGSIEQTVDTGRMQRSRLQVDAMYRSLCGRLGLVAGWSRMGVMLKLFLVYAVFGLAEVGVLLFRGFLNRNLFAEIQAMRW